MQKVGFKLKLKKDDTKEYKKRHDEIWPGMIKILKEAGIRNYSIWNKGKELFGYYEVEDLEYSNKIQAESEVVDKWNKYMQDLLVSKKDENGNIVPVIEFMDLMFYMK